MLLPLYIALAVAFVFYGLLPLVGAYFSRGQWRRFRERLVALSLAPRLKLGPWLGEAGQGGRQLPGRYRLYGAMEAIEGEDRMWVRSEGLTAIVDLGHAFFHILADEGSGGENDGSYAIVERLPWKKVRVFPEGAKVFVGGAVVVEGGKPLFVEAPGEPLIVVSYEGHESSLLSRLVAGGRRRNEYWNALSRVSIALGIGIMGVYLSLASGGEYFPTVIFLALLVALAPVLTLLPPGLPFFFLYLRFWKKGLSSRTMRDLLRLPLRFFRSETTRLPDGSMEALLPDGGTYTMRRMEGEPGEGFAVLVAGPRQATENWVVFGPEGTDDPAARRIAVAGDPESLAVLMDRKGKVSTMVAGLSLVAGIFVTIITAFVLWRLI
jgi:hypothetical protein